MKTLPYEEILKKKISHYGNTQAAYDFATEEYSRQFKTKKQMKTVKEWFELIKDEKIRKEALENMTPEWSGNEWSNINNAITDGFMWSDTPQEHDYWDKIYKSNIELIEEKPSPSQIIENTFNNIKTKKQMNTEDVMKQVESYRKNKISDLEKLVNEKHQELFKEIEELKYDLSKMLKQNVIESVEIKQTKDGEEIDFTKQQPQERKLIMSVDELINTDRFDDWRDENGIIRDTFEALKCIESQWNDGKEFDWKNEDDNKNCLFLWNNEWTYECFVASAQNFNFHTKEHAELFLETFAKELEIIKPLFS